MGRRIEITHIYDVELPTNTKDRDTIRAVAMTAVKIMEAHIQELNGIMNLRSDYKITPLVWSAASYPGELTVEEADERIYHQEGMATHQDVVHPWDQGLHIFPPDHPLYAAEEAAMQQEAERGETKEIEGGDN